MAAGIVLAVVPVIAEMQELKFSDQSKNLTEKFSRPTFDTVTIKEVKRSQAPLSMQSGPGSINFKSTTLRNIIQWAFRPQERWDMYNPGNDLGTLYDITAQGPPGIKPELMVRTLLEDRFKLKVHHELRLKDIYTLEISKSGPKLTPSSGGRSNVRREKNIAVFTHATMEMLCEFLNTEREFPVFDQTGLKGFYNFTLKLPSTAADSWEFPRYTNLSKQIGLELKSGKMRMDVLVLDHVEKLSQK